MRTREQLSGLSLSPLCDHQSIYIERSKVARDHSVHSSRNGHALMMPSSSSPSFASVHPTPSLKRIIKLGGAAITHKASFETLNEEVLRSVARSVAQAFKKESREGGIIVVHGAGSFGHHQVMHGEVRARQRRSPPSACRPSSTLCHKAGPAGRRQRRKK